MVDSKERVCRIFCPYHKFDSIEIGVVNRDEGGILVFCGSFRIFRLSGGCRSNGCCYLASNSIRQCPFERDKRIDLGRIMAMPEGGANE